MNKEELEKEIEATVRDLPQKPPERTVETMLSRGFMDKDFMLYKADSVRHPITQKREKMARLHCTACGQTEYVDYQSAKLMCSRYTSDGIAFYSHPDDKYIVSNDKCTCSECGKQLTAMHTSKISRYTMQIDSCLCLTVHNVRGHLCLLSWRITKHCDKEGIIVYYTNRWEGTLVIDRKLVRVCGHQGYFGGQIYFNWEYRKKYDDYIGACSALEVLDFSMDDIYATSAANCALDVYIDELSRIGNGGVWPTAYIKMWAKYPQVENLIRQGFGEYVEGIIDHCITNRGYGYNATEVFNVNSVKNYIDTKQNRPHLMLGVEKNEVHLAKRQPFDGFNIYCLARKIDNIKLNEKILDQIHAHKSRFAGYAEFFNKAHNGYRPKVLATVNYILRQTERLKKGNNLVGLQYLTDYWDMMFKVCEVMEPSLLYPKDLVKAHDDMQKRVKEKADEILSRKIHQQAEKHSNLCFTDDELGLMIFPCDSHAELINEGNKLDHCVARYAESVANGSTCILFIRKIAEPNKPFFTLEYKNGYVVQNRGKKNCARTEQVQKFENKWLEHLKNGGKKNVKRNNTRTEQRAGA